MIRLAACLLICAAGLMARQKSDPIVFADSASRSSTISPDSAVQDGWEPAAARHTDVSFFSGFGLSTGGGFGDALNADLTNEGHVTTGRMVFFTIEAGMEFRAMDHFFLTPRISWLHTTVNRRYDYSDGSDDLAVFSMLTCGAGGRYYIREVFPYLFYVQADLGYMMTASKVSGMPFSSDVLTTGLLAGYAYSWRTRAIGFELGYRSIPVSHPRSAVRIVNGHSAIVTETDRKDFGGMFMNVVWHFDLFDFHEREE